MSKYLKKFETTAAYEAAKDGLILPNVSICVDTPNEVHYNPYVEPTETRVVAKYNVTSTSSPTRIGGSNISGFSAVEIDGVRQTNVTTGYTFSTTGEHTVKYTLTNPTAIIYNAFSSCISLTNIVIPDSVTSIGGYAFKSCSGLTSIDIPSGVTSIGDEAFQGCSGLTSIDIPSGVTSIGERAFYQCSSLTSITVRGETPPYLVQTCDDDDNCWYDNFYTANNCPIYVPSASVDAYKSASGWSVYASRIQAIP